jgi:hypothetical protein
MSLSRNLPAELLSVFLLTSGCSAQGEPEGMSLPPSPPYEALDWPLSTNGMNPVDFWAAANQGALATLGAAALLDENDKLVATPLLDTSGGSSVLRYLIRCALNDETTVKSVGGAKFAGDIGLAPDWTSRALTTSEQRWITACLLDHLNGLGQSVSIALVGTNPALIADPGDDAASYTISDVTSFGNVFLGVPKAYVCADLGVSLGCGVFASIYTLQRLCGLSPTCGATNLGLCALVCVHDAVGNPSCTVPLGPTYAEAIATRLEATVAVSLYPLCSFP